MGLTDTLSDATNTAASALGAGSGADGPKPEAGKPEYSVKGSLDAPKDKKPITAGPNGGDTPPNTAQPPGPLEFVHFGYIHSDTSDHFAHDKYDNEKDKKPPGRAILFRDAVERESVLLYGYISATQRVHQELQKNRGAAGAAAAAVGSLIGSSGQEPDPKSYKHLLNAITKSGGDINAEKCDYIKTHKAGIDLHQTRADYVKYCTDKLEGYYLGGAKDDQKALLASLPSVSGAAKTLFGILFKAFDIYFGIHLKYRAAYEKAIEEACYKFSIDTVKNYKSNTYTPWFNPPKDTNKADKSTMPSVLGDAQNKYNQGRKDAEDFAQDQLEPEATPPGEPILNDLFSIFGSSSSEDADKKDGDFKSGDKSSSAADTAKGKSKPGPADTLTVDAFNKVLGVAIPDFVGTAIGKIVWGNVEFLKTVYVQLCHENDKKLDDSWLYTQASACILDKIYGFIEDNVSFIKSAEDYTFDAAGQKIGPGKQVDKGKDDLSQKVGGYAEPVLKRAVGKFSDTIEKIRSDATKNKLMTMEVFLGYLPYLLAFQVRNTTFPLWDLLINEKLGKLNTAISAAIKPVTNFIGDARTDAKNAKNDRDAGKEALDQDDKDGGLSTDNAMQNVSEYKDILTKDRNKDDPNKAAAGGSFPGGARKTAGNADKIASDDLDKAKKDRKDNWPAKP